jgi:hypothetical protein
MSWRGLNGYRRTLFDPYFEGFSGYEMTGNGYAGVAARGGEDNSLRIGFWKTGKQPIIREFKHVFGVLEGGINLIEGSLTGLDHDITDLTELNETLRTNKADIIRYVRKSQSALRRITERKFSFFEWLEYLGKSRPSVIDRPNSRRIKRLREMNLGDIDYEEMTSALFC